MKLDHCFNTQQFRRFAKKRLPGPIFHYIDGAADDEVTYRRTTSAYDDCDLVPNVLAGVEKTLSNFQAEIERGMKLMGARSVTDLGRENLRYR